MSLSANVFGAVNFAAGAVKVRRSRIVLGSVCVDVIASRFFFAADMNAPSWRSGAVGPARLTATRQTGALGG
jgi:hypothetical protein